MGAELVIMRKVVHVGLSKWRPAAFEPIDTLFSTWFLVVLGAVRGLDYFRTDDTRATAALSLIEQTFPLDVWGSFFLGGACVLALGLIVERHFIVWLGHTVLGISYFVLALGLVIPMLGMGVALAIFVSALLLGLAIWIGRRALPQIPNRLWIILGRVAIAVGLISTVFLPPGLRTGVQTSYIAAGHFLLWLRTGSSPLVEADTETVSRVQGDR